MGVGTKNVWDVSETSYLYTLFPHQKTLEENVKFPKVPTTSHSAPIRFSRKPEVNRNETVNSSDGSQTVNQNETVKSSK